MKGRFHVNKFSKFPWPTLFLSFGSFALTFKIFRHPRFFNVICEKDDLQGDGEWLLVLSFLWTAFSVELLVADYFCYGRRPRYHGTFRFNLAEDWLGCKPIPFAGVGIHKPVEQKEENHADAQ